MSERIRELAEQADYYACEQYGVEKVPYSVLFNQKFTELIVQRTLAIVEAHTEIFQSSEARAMVEHIKHSVKTDFGVED